MISTNGLVSLEHPETDETCLNSIRIISNLRYQTLGNKYSTELELNI
jgi:hypothetical protein